MHSGGRDRFEDISYLALGRAASFKLPIFGRASPPSVTLYVSDTP